MHSLARSAISQLLTDECQILDPARAAGSLNETTMAVSLAETEIYAGRCLVQTAASTRGVMEGGEEARADELRLRLPADAPEVPSGSTIRILASCDAEMVGLEFEAIRSEVRTMRGSRRVTMRRRTALGSTGGAA